METLLENDEGMETLLENDDALWRAVAGRDRASAGHFVYAVTSTGVFCRPGCPSRTPRRAHVRYFTGSQAARDAGFRPCRRCRPEEEDALVARALGLIEGALAGGGRGPTLDELGAALAVSPGTLRRRFRGALGVSPRAWADRLRREAFREGLRRGEGVAAALYDAGYGSPSRVYEKGGRLGMTPATYAKGGRGARIAFAIVDSPLDRLLVAATERGVCAVYLGDDDTALEAELEREFPHAEIARDGATLRRQVAAVLAAIGGAPAAVPLDVRASAFQARVWEALAAIPTGETRRYGEIAASIGAPGAARAVGRACATNPVSVVVPCHRAVGGRGGYRWGIERKERLLAIERGGK